MSKTTGYIVRREKKEEEGERGWLAKRGKSGEEAEAERAVRRRLRQISFRISIFFDPY